MKADLIIFDKDGTLLDFDAFWVSVSVKAIEYVLRKAGCEDVPVDEILSAIGVTDGVTDIDGALCKGTYLEIAELIYGVVAAHGCRADKETVIRLAVDAYNQNADSGEVRPTCEGLCDTLRALKDSGAALAVVTTDNPFITELCLKKLGVYELFYKIYTDDDKTPTKPDPYCALELMRLTGVDASRVIMVGDTITDVNFAKNAGITAVSVARSDKLRERLSPYADIVIGKISELPALLS